MKTRSFVKAAGLSLMLAVTGSYFAAAQSPCDLTSSIIINTGYDPVSGGVIPLMSVDPLWRITDLSADCIPLCSPYVTPGTNDAIAMPPLTGGYAWATDPASQWLCFNTTTGYPGYPTFPANNYTMTLTRTFKNCTEDDYIIDMRMANDNSIADMNIDGHHFLFSQPTSNNPSYFMSFMHLHFTVHLGAGTHYFNVKVVNWEPQYHPSDDHGLNIVGTISSATSTTSLVTPVSDPNCCCGGGSGSACAANKVDLTASFNSADTARNCMFDCLASVTAGAGWTPVTYTWSSPAVAIVSGTWPALLSVHPSSALTDVQSLTTPVGSAHIPLLVEVMLVKGTDTCIVRDSALFDCNGGYGFVFLQKAGNPGNTLSGITEAPDDIQLFPNPTSTTVTIAAGGDKITQVQVMDITGKQLATYSYASATKVTVSLQQLPPGSYTLRINGKVTKKVSKTE